VSKAQIASLQVPAAIEKEAAKKAMKSDSKTGKIVKVIAIVGVTGALGFGIYKYIQIKKKSNGYTGANKGK
jgi:Holliday junction resolvasome RuvABC endonuclease subunit